MNCIIEKGKPFTLLDGSIVLPEPNASGDIVVTALSQKIDKEISRAMDAPFTNMYSEPMKRTMNDIQSDHKTSNITMLILSYSMWGLDNLAIARMLNVSIDDIIYVQGSKIYKDYQQQMIESIRYAETSTVHGYISQNAQLAAQTVVGALGAKNIDTRLAAAKDILDRGGFRPADRIEHVHSVDDELRIVMVKERDTPTIDIKIG